MHYKGYLGSFELDEDEAVFYGKVEYIKALISYEATTAKSLRKAFQEAVDDYLQMCKVEGIEPEVPFKGSFNVRVGQALHRRLALEASKREMTLNKFICYILAESTHHQTDAR